MSEPERAILLVYVVVDESWSMKPSIGELDQGLTSLLGAMQAEPLAASKIMLSVVGFSDDALCHLPPSDLREIENIPSLTARNNTSYTAAFEYLYSAIPLDVQWVKDSGYLAFRPAVFFLTDGEHNTGGDWKPIHAKLTAPDFNARPNILAFGIGAAATDAAADTIRRIATRPDYAYQAAHGSNTGEAVKKFALALTRSLIVSGNAAAYGTAEVLIEKPEGFIPLGLDLV